MPKEITEDWMHLQFVGSGDAFGSGGRFNTCFHVVGEETNFLIDCGASSLIAMNRFGIDRNAIAILDKAERTAGRGLRIDLANHQALVDEAGELSVSYHGHLGP